MSAFALVAAALLLVEVLRLRRVAAGAAYAEHMSFVMGGVAALVASVLVGRVPAIVPDALTAGEARFLSDALVGISMVLLGVYFLRVRRAMARYLDVLEADELIARAHVGAPDGEGRSGE